MTDILLAARQWPVSPFAGNPTEGPVGDFGLPYLGAPENFSRIFQDDPIPGEFAFVYTVYMDSYSWITISQSDPRPLYLQVIEQIQRRVAVGDLTPGADLPSIRQLAADLKVSLITIKRAYLELEREGVIATRQGKGSVVADRPGLKAAIQERELQAHLREAASLGLLLGISKTEIQKRIAESYDKAQRNVK